MKKYTECGAGDLGPVANFGDVVGPCPSCGDQLKMAKVDAQKAMLSHPIPFCDYFGSTDPNQILADVRKVIS